MPAVIALIQSLGPALLALGGAVLAALVASYHRGRKAGIATERARHAAQATSRAEAGRSHLARNRGADPAERLRRNEGRWQ